MYKVWAMQRARKTYKSQLCGDHADARDAQAMAETQMGKDSQAYVYIVVWRDGQSHVVWDSLSGWNVTGDPREALRRLLQS